MGGVNRTPAQTACTDAHSVSQHILNRMVTFHHGNTRLKIAHLCVSKQLSSTCHVSSFAAPDTDHKHKFSITYLSDLSDVLSLTPKSSGARSKFTLRRSTTEWRINTNPISHITLLHSWPTCEPSNVRKEVIQFTAHSFDHEINTVHIRLHVLFTMNKDTGSPQATVEIKLVHDLTREHF